MSASAATTPKREERLRETLEKFLVRGARADISRLLGKVRPQDVALLLRAMSSERQLVVLEVLAADYPDAAGEVFTELDPAERLALVERMAPEQTAAILERIPVDDAVFVVEGLPRDLHDRILQLVDLKDLTDVQTQLAYREGSAGRLMDTESFALPETELVRDAVAAIQEQRDVEMIFYLYVVDRDAHLVGVTSLRQLLLSPPQKTLGEIMNRSVIKVGVDTDQEEVAGLAARYDLLAIPVVDDNNHLAGIVTVDDIIDVVKEEATEDLFKIAGTSEDELLYEARAVSLARLRLPSLLVSLVGLLATGFILFSFRGRFAGAMYLLAFVPVVMGLGGAIGGQSLTVTVRGLASGRLGKGEKGLGSFFARQLEVGGILGLACAVVVGSGAALLQRDAMVGFVVGGAILGSIVLAAALGVLLPAFLRLLGVDPAVASGPIVTAVNDITGILIYMGLAGALIDRLPR